MTSSVSSEAARLPKTTPRAKTWENRSSSGRTGAEKSILVSLPTNSFVEQARSSPRNGVPSRHTRDVFSGPRTTKTAYTVSSRASRRDIED